MESVDHYGPLDELEVDEIKRHSATELEEREASSMDGNAWKLSEEVKKTIDD